MPAISVTANGTARRRSRRGRGPRSVIAVGLVVGMRRAERLELHAIGVDPRDRRIGGEVKLVALRIDRLRDKCDVREPGRAAMAERTGPPIRGEQLLERLEAG